jgi:23S rRNA pseudouridine2457 synthase
VVWLELKLREGKKRQIRHMTAAVGLFTLRLVRVAIGNIKLKNLPSGVWRELTSEETRSLRER